MRHITYAYLGPEDRAGKYAKKGTATDITLFNAKKGDIHLNLVTASRFPDKIMSLLYALDLADEVILQPEKVDRSLGEMVVAAELLGKTKGFLRAEGAVNAAELQNLLSKTALKDLTLSTDPEGVFREQLYERQSARPSEPLAVPVDHAFPVKGVGTVALALVRSGTLKHHASLQSYPTTKMADVRSIQVHDVDQDSAAAGARVGLALKGAEPEDVNRGHVLAPQGSLQVAEAGKPIEATFVPHPFSKWTPKAGAVLHLFHVLQDVVVRVDDVKGAAPNLRLILKPEAPLTKVPGQPMVLVDIDNKAQRLAGRVQL
jgi:selenocysteine-specific translation elongation factor